MDYTHLQLFSSLHQIKPKLFLSGNNAIYEMVIPSCLISWLSRICGKVKREETCINSGHYEGGMNFEGPLGPSQQ